MLTSEIDGLEIITLSPKSTNINAHTKTVISVLKQKYPDVYEEITTELIPDSNDEILIAVRNFVIINDLINAPNRKMIPIIKKIRGMTNCSLKEAKNILDHFKSGGRVVTDTTNYYSERFPEYMV